ncbi:hypothetical protein SEA_OZZYJ_47 [Streptomyces phage OzzyJ]|nr:hypothetical protein SEA_OZZYJ_47 [Streptomyces phage OzzyJ]QFP95213.1 hypothetical protein SEA_WHATEVER_46 [Streptomyces phage Whatever]QQO39661.1 hypothetical protein SEA_HIPPO_46 [Streptomyces phage Hippo]QQO39968.1 hypothetical protein SEA_DWAYNE_46 [Streptomyces phage Dwayne]QYW07965.1 hypothetical protein SEA_TRISTE_46 [Streptomyces phage Triste]QZE11114.1 hypothetical protein SEA_SARAHROSE_46 [Streptomyces phage SarahRose]WAB09829.1 hypothetical protein SEA_TAGEPHIGHTER_48 [Streptom
MSDTSPIPAGQSEFYDDVARVYYWFNEEDRLVYSRPYTQTEVAGMGVRGQLDLLRAQADEAMVYLDERIDISLLYLENLDPTPEQMAEQVKVLSDLAAYSAGTLKRLILVLGSLVNRPVDMV